ncbi:UDP-glucosyltransferase 2-like [Cloeon dipterum]|uniref:UDP-glucosyltransferase 2-like n=1 Tax=Cloeon dipterum TaxID=197152 RepID=UPI0032200CF5
MRLCSLALILCAGLSAAHGARILCLFGVSGKSHNNFFSALTRELANRGHDLTVLTSYPTNKTSANYKEIAVDVMDKVGAVFSPFTHTEENFFSQFGSIIKIFVQTCPYVLQTPQVKPLLNEKFDLVFISMFFNQCFLPFGYLNGAPVITISPGGSFGMGMDMENPEPTSYVPSIFLPFTSKMTFTERVANTVITQLISALGTYYLKPHMHQAAKEFFGPNIPTIEEMEKNISLVIYNNHFSLNSPRPLNPGIIEAGGMHIKEKNEKLSKDLQDFMDGAKDGVIYFSMGSVVQGSQMPKDKLNALLGAFSDLPQRVIFKWETDEMPGRPKNVKIGKWLPQQAILAHPNIRLFITHGGLLSTQEAAYHGVPLVGIPFFGDQQLNVAKSARMGFAVGLDFNTLSKQSVLQAIKTVVNNPSFLKNAQDLKRRVRDQPDKPLDRALFWTEYVLRHNGAPHLRTAATDMRWWQVHLIDVYGAIFTFIFAVLLFDYYLIKWCCCRSKNKPGKAGTSKSAHKGKKKAE